MLVFGFSTYVVCLRRLNPRCLDFIIDLKLTLVARLVYATRKTNVTVMMNDSIFPLPAEINNEELAEIGLVLNMRRGFDMSAYKDKYLMRRVSIRMRSARCQDAAEYCNLLRQSDQELDLLQKVLTIHVSQFFRNPSMFEKLRTEILPSLFRKGKGTAEHLRFWCLGCAGGEEPYSLAILLREHFSPEIHQTPASILGTDIDAATLVTAQQAEYSAERLQEVSSGLRDHYFRQNGTRFRLIPEIREMVTFMHGDITNVEQYIASDMVLCRNTLIYFNRADQEKIQIGIADILSPSGILVLGKSETLVGEARLRFVPVCQVERIFRRI